MDGETSVHAGGARKNRQEIVFVTLDPGIYTLKYQTDGSHSWEDWNSAPPDNPERWGVSLFTMPGGSIELLEDTNPETLPGTSQETNTLVVHKGASIVNWTRLEGYAELSATFTLEEAARLRIVAMGEIGRHDRYDYGWISQREENRPVWDMNLDNTLAAGGSARNRLFDSVIELEAGQYEVHFVTDDTHHYGNFDAETPDQPELWGISIYYVDRDS